MKASLIFLLFSLSLSPGTIPPEIEAKDLKGTPVSLQDFRGKVVLVDFWATWCIPCRRSIPIYAKMHRSLKDKGFEVLAISVDEELNNVTAYVEKNQLPFRVVHDKQGSIAENYEPSKMPTSYLIGADGKLVQVYAGFNDEIHESLEATVDRLLKELGKQPPKTEPSPEKKDPEPEEPKPDDPRPEDTPSQDPPG